MAGAVTNLIVTEADADGFVWMSWMVKCRPGTVYIQKPPPLLVFIFMLLFTVVGSCLGLVVGEVMRVSVYGGPVEFSEELKNSDSVSVKTRPAVMVLRFKPPNEIEAEKGKDVYAYARIYGNPCEIVFPSEQTILVEPKSYRARWEKNFNNEALAHEILHCLHGLWHK